jgi:hypothetical protein
LRVAAVALGVTGSNPHDVPASFDVLAEVLDIDVDADAVVLVLEDAA